MKYMGGKFRHAKQIIEVINTLSCASNAWVEPFVGGGNVLTLITGRDRYANDVNHHLIALFKALQDGWVPPESISEEEYQKCKALKNKVTSEDALVAFVGFGCSFGGKWFRGYARSKIRPRNYALESKRNLLSLRLNGVVFSSVSYSEMYIPPNSVIYCDPPYFGTESYKDKFNSGAFWVWCDRMVSEGHAVFVSEYSAPSHWRCVWEKTVSNSLTVKGEYREAVERLFTRG